ncbi:unnamed protein product [Meganyctiphanes norvegica]|uniref:Receptor L-domain domain-containing protein n=1 Tax=Meganyctiphanes norvegica TaxID=48144 RepID=A0AAV2RNG9_MEGNR
MATGLVYPVIFFHIYFLVATVAYGSITVNNVSSAELSQCILSSDELLCDFVEMQEELYVESIGSSTIRRVTIINARNLYFATSWYVDLELIECTAYFRNTNIQNAIELKLINSNIDNIPNGVSLVNIQGSKVGQIINITSIKVLLSQVEKLTLKDIDINYFKIQSSSITSVNIRNISVGKNAELSVIGSNISCIYGDMFKEFKEKLKWENSVMIYSDNCQNNEAITNTPGITSTVILNGDECNTSSTVNPKVENCYLVPVSITVGILASYSVIMTVAACTFYFKFKSNHASNNLNYSNYTSGKGEMMPLNTEPALSIVHVKENWTTT